MRWGFINAQVIEEIMNHFGRTGPKQRPRIRKFHAELLAKKYIYKEKVLSADEIMRPDDYIHRMVKYSKGFIEFINEEKLELKLTTQFFDAMDAWHKQYTLVEELDYKDENLLEQGILIKDDKISFDGRLTYSRFYKVISDEGENMNDPESWTFNDKNIESLNYLNFANKSSPAFQSRLFLMKFYILRMIDEVAFVTSRFVHCPKCGGNYVIPAAKIEFQQTYKCEAIVGDKPCGTALKKFPARKMIPTYIYEVAIEVQGRDGVEFKEFFLESFVELHPGFYTGMLFGRTETKSNSFYFTCLTAKEEKSKIPFEFIITENSKHRFYDLINSIVNHIKKVGFVIDEDKARIVYNIETVKKLTLVVNKEINMDHSLYFGAPGIGKTYALTLLNHLFYSNSGSISGPRFTLAGLTGGQKEIFYQDTGKKKNVPGLFSNQAFLFDEINNAQFLADNKAINLFKSVALAASGTSSTVGGKEFPRIALISGTANYDINYLRHYENKVKKIYSQEVKKTDTAIKDQATFLSDYANNEIEVPQSFDFYAPLREYGPETPKALKLAILKIRDEPVNYLTSFEKPLMERFYWSVLVHPKYDKSFLKQKTINVLDFMKSRTSIYTQRELISQLFVPEFDKIILDLIEETKIKFNDPEIEEKWSKQAQEFLNLMANKYINFFSMFNRISQAHVFILYSLSLINGETTLSFETRRIYERLISLLHTPIDIKDFHSPDFENFAYIGENKGELLEIIKRYPARDLRELVDTERKGYKTAIVKLLNDFKINQLDEFRFELNNQTKFEEINSEKPLDDETIILIEKERGEK